MRYSLELRRRKQVQGYGFLSFARKFCDKFGKRLLDTATKTGIDVAKAASKRAVQKTAEATGDLIGIKQLIKLLQWVHQKIKKIRIKQTKQKKFTYHQKKDSKLLFLKIVLDVV